MKTNTLRQLRQKYEERSAIEHDEFGWNAKVRCAYFEFHVRVKSFEDAKEAKEDIIRDEIVDEIERIKNKPSVRRWRKIRKILRLI